MDYLEAKFLGGHQNQGLQRRLLADCREAQNLVKCWQDVRQRLATTSLGPCNDILPFQGLLDALHL